LSALAKGYQVNCLARNSARIAKQNRLTVYLKEIRT
ncbi:MAG: hypothetical protein ACI9DM_002911, partial [Cyclobacteriaceae bacterium]